MRSGRVWLGSLRGAALALLLGAACARPPVDPGLTGPALDRQLRELVELRLLSDRRLCPYVIRVIAYNGTVELDGLVDAPAERTRATEIARRAGARRVVDRLQLSLSSGDAGRC